MDDHFTDDTDDAFNLLAMKALCSQLSPEEEREFKAILASSAQREEEYQSLLETHQIMRSAGNSHFAFQENGDIPEPSQSKMDHLYQLVKNADDSSRSDTNETAQFNRNSDRSNRNWGQILSFSGLGLAAMFIIAFFVATETQPDYPATHTTVDTDDDSDLFAMRGAASDDSPQDDSAAVRAYATATPVAFVLEPPKGAIIKRSSNRLTPEIGEALYAGDVLIVPDAQKMSVLLSNGQRMLEGPITHTVTAPNAMLQISSPLPMTATTDTLLGTRGQGSSTDLESFVFAPAASALATVSMSVHRNSSAITLFTPVGEIGFLNPRFDWEAILNATYTIELVNALDRNERFSLNGVAPPVRLEALTGDPLVPLQPDSLYELIIRQDGAPLTTSKFSFMTSSNAGTLPENLTPAETLTLMQELALLKRWSDILTLALTLPEHVRSSPYSIRLRALAHSKLSHSKAFDALEEQLF